MPDPGRGRRRRDGLAFSVLLYLLGLLIGALLGLFMALSGATPAQGAVVGGVLGVLSGAIYEIGFHAWSFQAMVGKATLRIKVTDEEGKRLSVARSTGRYIAKLLSFWTLGAGSVMAGFTRSRQALHDKVAGTLVVRAQAPPALVASAAPAPPAGPVQIALLLLLGLLPYVLLGITVLPVWQLMQRAATEQATTHAPPISQEELEAGRRQVRAALFAVQPHRAQLSGRLASGERFEQVGGTL